MRVTNANEGVHLFRLKTTTCRAGTTAQRRRTSGDIRATDDIARRRVLSQCRIPSPESLVGGCGSSGRQNVGLRPDWNDVWETLISVECSETDGSKQHVGNSRVRRRIFEFGKLGYMGLDFAF